jgi:hypothetical protein
MRIKLGTYCLSFLLLAACGAPKETIESKKEPIPEKPSWVDNRPVSGAYYIGVGVASKLREPIDYQAVAKKNALNDLASEISVVISGETFLNTLEVNKHFQEEFISNINTSTSEQIESYEVAGLWEDGEAYWIYYRLSKAEHARFKKEKKDQALNAANDYFVKARDASSNGNMSASIDMHIRALFEMKNYWTEVNEYEVDGKKIFLDNEIYASLSSTVSGMNIEPVAPSVVLQHDNDFTNHVLVTVLFEGKPINNIPLLYSYDKGKFARPKSLLTNDAGSARITVADANITNPENVLEIDIDLDDLVGDDLDRKLLKPIISNLKTDSEKLPIEIVFPSAHLQFDEKNFDERSESPHLSNSIKSELTKKGIRFTDSPVEANYLIRVVSNTTQGGTSQGFHVAYLSMTISVVDTKTNKEVYRQAESSVKGLQLNFGAAGLEAYKKGSKKIQEEIAEDLIDSIL